MWEFAPQDLLPLIRRDRDLRGEVLKTEGNYLVVRFNHPRPPFDRPTIRPRYTDAEAKTALENSGYRGEKIVQISPADYPDVRAANEVLAGLLKRIGINLEYISVDWSTMTQRVVRKDKPEAGGFHIHMLNVPFLPVASPMVNSRPRGTGSDESGWYTSARHEEPRGAWLLSETPEEQRKPAEALQRECQESVPLVPCGVTMQPAAWRPGLDGVLPGVPKFWNVRRSG